MQFLRKLFTGAPAAPAVPAEITRTSTKQLFTAIRHGELATVKAFLAANPDYTNVCATAPPKKDDGQSPLHVALKTGQFAIADYLIDHGANVNFMEDSKINEWRTPVLHDAIRAALFSSVDNKFEPAVAVLRKMLQRGANPNAVDSYGNTCLMRAILDANIRIRGASESGVTPQLLKEFGEVFTALTKAGADIHGKGPDRASAVEETRGTVLEQFLS
jgi:ankyrin repeat protein